MRTLIISALFFCSVLSTAQKTTSLTVSEKTNLIDSIALRLQNYYVFPDKAKEMAQYLKKRNKEKAYVGIADYKTFIDTLRNDLQKVHKDLHMSLSYNPEQVSRVRKWRSMPQPSTEMIEERRVFERKANYGFVKVERLPGNIGYVDFRQFSSINEEAENTVAAAMGFIAHSDAVIIDLRNNGGGDPRMVQLIVSYFLDEKPVHYNSIYNRPNDSMEHYYSLEKVKGKKMPDVDLYVLTSKQTFSGAEEFAYNIKNLKRGTIIGETTGGGAHPTSLYVVNDYVVMAIPDARSINPFTKTNWEAVGVEPDIKVEAQQALLKAQHLAINKLIAKATNPVLKSQLQWQQEAVAAAFQPVKISDQLKAAYAGNYGERAITLENGELYYQRQGRAKFKMIPLTQTTFRMDGLDYFRIKFVNDSSGKIEKLIGLYETGETDESIRTVKTF